MRLFKRLSTLGIVFSLIAALSVPSTRTYAAEQTVLNLPAPGSMIQLSEKFAPPVFWKVAAKKSGVFEAPGWLVQS